MPTFPQKTKHFFQIVFFKDHFVWEHILDIVSPLICSAQQLPFFPLLLPHGRRPRIRKKRSERVSPEKKKSNVLSKIPFLVGPFVDFFCSGHHSKNLFGNATCFDNSTNLLPTFFKKRNFKDKSSREFPLLAPPVRGNLG